MSYDPDKMAEIAQGLFQVQVEAVHGEAGIASLQAVLQLVRSLYLHRSPEGLSRGLVVFQALPGMTPPAPAGPSTTIAVVQSFPERADGAVVEVRSDGTLTVWGAAAIDPQALASHAVVYAYTPDSESIVLPSGHTPVPNPVGYPSALAPPTFWNLEEALGYYATHLAARSTCKILKTVWAVDASNRRLVLCNHPEVIMRESLAQHLRSSVRDTKLVRVLEEQNVSETEPVDIEVSWSLTSHIALIEVKWLGKCLNDDASDLASYAYGDARAREGAVQLANYLDEFRERTPGHEIRGYLVVYDARRWGVTNWQPDPITYDHAWHYADRELDYADSLPERVDFKEPRRFYLEPSVAA